MKTPMALRNLAIVFSTMALLAGCSTVEISAPGAMKPNERLLTIQSDGYAIIDTIPLWSGYIEVDEHGEPHPTFAVFQDCTHSDELYEQAQAIAKGQNCELTNVVFMNNYKGIDIRNFYGLFTVYDVALSAVLKSK